ncbi:MAG TPA: hypothetical protein PLG56_01750 [Lacunisphaera sp.]|jgi:hypothetical protein|nr:hypothetical protein [Lacunisphaera sp.]
MNNPERILHTLDRHLRQQTRIVLFGRAALALGYPDAPQEFGVTQDVDALLPAVEMTRIEADRQFWDALEAANTELEPTGLYMTHLFTDEQVVLTSAWLQALVPIPPTLAFRHVELARPSGIDLILTKMMRNDPQDLQDIRFLLGREKYSAAHLLRAFADARVPAIAEIGEAFLAMQPVVLSIADSQAS